MPVYLFTYHTYRSWMPDNPRGYVLKGEGLQESSDALANTRADLSKHPPFLFDSETERLAINVCLDVCQRRDWTLHAAATEPTHLHVLVSWKTELRWQDLRGKI